MGLTVRLRARPLRKGGDMRYALLVCDDEKAVLSPEAREDRTARFNAFQDEMEARGGAAGS